MANITLKVEEVEQIKNSLVRVTGEIESISAEINSEAQKTQNGWTGQNANAFLEEMVEFKKRLDAKCDELATFVTSELETAKKKIQEADQMNSQTAANLNGGVS